MIKNNFMSKTLFYFFVSSVFLFGSNIGYKIDKALETTHEYAGYTMLGLVSTNMYLGLTNEDGFSSRDDKSLHQDVGNILSNVVVASALIGLYSHREDLFDFSEGFTSKHLHAILGLTAMAFALDNLEFNLQNHKDSGLIAGALMYAAYAITF